MWIGLYLQRGLVLPDQYQSTAISLMRLFFGFRSIQPSAAHG
jgi:hypothetical protein